MGLSQDHGNGLRSVLPPVVCLSFGWWDIPDGLQQSEMVEPVHPFQGGQFHGFLVWYMARLDLMRFFPCMG